MRQLLIVVLIGFVLYAVPAKAEDNSLSSKIAFVGYTYDTDDHSGKDQVHIYTIDPDGSNVRDVYTIDIDKSNGYPYGTEERCNCEFAWSPDHHNLIFTLDYPGYPFKTYIIRADGSGGQLYNSDYASFKWSPDGKSLAYLYKKARTLHTSGLELYIASADGSNPKRFVDREVTDFAWNSDSKQLAISSLGTIYTTPVEGALALKPLTTNDLKVNGLSWSPEGRYILFVYRSAVYALNIQSRVRQKLVPRTDYSQWFGNHQYRWSPVGSAFLVDNVYFFTADGKARDLPMPPEYSQNNPQGYNSDYQVIEISWSPDGTSLLYGYSERSLSFIYTWKLSDPSPVLIPTAGEPSRYGLDYGAWSSDSKEVAYVQDAQICITNIDSAAQRCITQVGPDGFLGKVIWAAYTQ